MTKRGERGAAMVEFAIVLPLFLVMVLAAIDWGWFFVVRDAASNAAREGARAAIVGQDGSARATAVLAAMLPTSQSSLCTVTQTTVVNGIRVQTTCPVDSLSGITEIPPLTWFRPIPAMASVVMRQ